MNVNELIRNCAEHSLEELAPYVGQYVAWSEDGKVILAHASTLADLFQEVKRRGISRYVTDWIDPPEEVFLGGGIL